MRGTFWLADWWWFRLADGGWFRLADGGWFQAARPPPGTTLWAPVKRAMPIPELGPVGHCD